MTTGPIDFGDAPRETLPASEYGGVDGLIQPETVGKSKGDGHQLTVSENSGVLRRAGMEPLSPSVGWTGVADNEDIVDPVTGRMVDVSQVTEVGGKFGKDGKLRDVQKGVEGKQV